MCIQEIQYYMLSFKSDLNLKYTGIILITLNTCTGFSHGG